MRNENMTTRISVSVTEEMKQELEAVAANEERNLSWIVRKAIQEYLDKQQEN